MSLKRYGFGLKKCCLSKLKFCNKSPESCNAFGKAKRYLCRELKGIPYERAEI